MIDIVTEFRGLQDLTVAVLISYPINFQFGLNLHEITQCYSNDVGAISSPRCYVVVPPVQLVHIIRGLSKNGYILYQLHTWELNTEQEG